MTEKLFYLDSHMTTFSAMVLNVEQIGENYEVVLDRTAFFPTGGGQYADTGVLGEVKVLDVTERNGVVYHITDGPLKTGENVVGEIEKTERFSKMQQHSGEHIVSGLVHQTFGYDNVGFHMGKDAITMDFNGSITPSQLREIEWKANEIIVQNIEILTHYPTKEELKNIEYRSKIEIEGQVRLVEIPGVDCCACCAPHVKKTGEVGVIRLLGVQNYKGGVRVSMLCGFRALEDAREKSDSVKRIAMMFSAKDTEVVDEVIKLREEYAIKKQEIMALQQQFLAYKVAELPEGSDCIIEFDDALSPDNAREYMNMILARGTRVAAIFVGTETSGYRYVIGGRDKDVRPISKVLNEKFSGRGGGKAEMVQGSLVGSECDIRREVLACSEQV